MRQIEEECRLYGRAEKPPLGQPPAYTSNAFENVPGLSRTDSQILKILGDLAVEQGEAQLLIDPEPISSDEGA